MRVMTGGGACPVARQTGRARQNGNYVP
jgi:hypothetical protein